MSKPHRCPGCKHRPGKRVLVYVKNRGGAMPAEPRQHKKLCDCACHREAAS